MTKDDAISRIRKLLNTKGRTDHEADTAQILAAALAEKHGIDIAAIDQADEKARMEITHRDVGEWYKVPCEADYAAAICQRFFEITNLTRCGLTEKMTFVGTAWHLDIAEYIFNFLVKEFRWQWNHRRGRSRKRKDFIYGCYCALRSKLRERFATPSEPGIEISWTAKRQKYINDNFGKTTTSSIAPQSTKSVSINRGYAAGRDIEIRPGVNAGTAGKPVEQIGFNSRLLPAPKNS